MLFHLVVINVQVSKYKNSQRFSKGVLSPQTYFYARSRLSGVAVKNHFAHPSVRLSVGTHVTLRATDQSFMKFGIGEF
jgi:hypothetical protein